MDKPYRILIVDDDKLNIQILTELLHQEYQIIAAKSGPQALKAAAGPNPPDLILMDIIMPDMDGYEVCKHLKDNEKTQHIPVIFVTAISEAMDKAKAFDMGGVDYVTKPFTPSAVKARIRTHIQLNVTMRKLEEALAKVKKLTGLLPICVNCKKIRDDKGYWNRVESYLQKNTEATFSHGLCPDCNDELYGDKKWYQRMKKEKELEKEKSRNQA
ncbi:MAG TPA: response regulator [Desulfobacteraceae bacterium]|nr:response regulator [Desulfobacteraceae bacterium]|tara:strand:- start:34 stop:675 length:642 start_codon:yes stop_codon:yes gene_type:complete